MQTKGLLRAQQELDNLTKMRMRDLINDEEYVSQRNELRATIAQLRNEIKNTEKRADQWLELTEQTFDFASYARHNFSSGDKQTKKEILMTLGNNPTLADGVLRIERSKWLQPIAESYPVIQAEYQRAITAKNLSTNRKTATLTAVRSSWLTTIEEVITTINGSDPWTT